MGKNEIVVRSNYATSAYDPFMIFDIRLMGHLQPSNVYAVKHPKAFQFLRENQETLTLVCRSDKPELFEGTRGSA